MKFTYVFQIIKGTFILNIEASIFFKIKELVDYDPLKP